MDILLNTILMIVVAIAIPGVINRTRSVLAGRKGLRFTQHLRNVNVLLRKGAVYSTTTTALFRIAPAVYLGAAIVAMLFIPVANLNPLISFEGDVICFAYTLALARVAIILAAMDTGSSFEGMGAAREALYGALIEPALMIGFATLAMFCGYTSFADIFAHEQSFNLHLTIVMMLIAYLFIKIAFVESGRVPVDDPRTHLELTMIHEAMLLDVGGPDLAFALYGAALKFELLAAFLIMMFMPNFGNGWLHILLLFSGIGLVSIATGVIESVMARMRFLKSPQTLMCAALIASLAVLIFVCF
jgi:formate hydrogenlyase subunit 4